MTDIRSGSDELAANKRTATLWFPALFSLIAAMGSLMVLRQMGPRPHILWVGRMPVLLYVPWLALLPLAGTIGAFLSRRGGGKFSTCLTASMFPAMTLCGLLCVGLTWMAINGQLDRPRWLYVALGVFNWAVLPSVALLLGAAPFLVKPISSRPNLGEPDLAKTRRQI
jgi:hypothetical protein